MAQYTYKCENEDCLIEFETEHSITQHPGAVCPDCKSYTESRLIYGTGFVLKGSGWFKDGY